MAKKKQPSELDIRFHPNRKLRHFLLTPITWMMLFPVLLCDLFLEIYHRLAFPLLGIPYVKRSEYIRIFDREKLPYLTWAERWGCAYCGYVNGWLHYASVVAGKTEGYWCAIAHLETRGYKPSEHEKDFVKYGDEAALLKRYHIQRINHPNHPKTKRTRTKKQVV